MLLYLVELTPERHEDSVEYCARVIKQVGDPGVVADLVEGPGAAVGALWTHGDAENNADLENLESFSGFELKQWIFMIFKVELIFKIAFLLTQTYHTFKLSSSKL